ncbi:hypothetical protein L6164_027466 [Bauhinia variegata]|uniref:Uncharacterized protein n=1 Tax=Bauhinia variegata TaxID=167791 RepID=A0ACB9LUW5_BAUVA|nr:hypothetical protein L6164_027466 [Bauhinia variegata]
MAMPSQDDDAYLSNGQITYILVVMGSAAFLVIIYHLVGICLRNQRIANQNPEQEQRHRHLVNISPSETPSQTSVASLIPSHKYKKKEVVSEDDTCAVCLGEFEEGDELRTLPECMHSYHVSCIDKWFYLHSSCPICRKLAMPSPGIHSNVPDFGSGEVNRHHNS